jgi:hypothetical protein
MAGSSILHCTELLHTTKPGHVLQFIFAICEVLFSSGHCSGLLQTLDVLLTQLAEPFQKFHLKYKCTL